MARGGFLGPRTVLEGMHGFYRAFAPSVAAELRGRCSTSLAAAG